jgi:capsular exopolysaccharide synthesis family protein
LAASIANTTAEAFIEENALEIGRPGTVSISQTAVPPSSPVEPKVGMYTLVAMVLGFVVAAVYARGLEYLDDSIKTPDDIDTVLHLPTLGVIGRADSGGVWKAWNRVSGQVLSPFLEDVRELRTRIHFLKLDSDLKTIAVVSQNPDEGKTTTAASLAEVLAEAGDQVILVDTNLRRPRLHEIYGLSNSFGLTGLLMQEDVEGVVLESTKVKNLRLLTSGPLPLSPSELLTSKRMTQVISFLRDSADYVIFDTSPLVSGSDALIVASKVDGTLAVVQAGRGRSQDVSRSIQRFGEARARILGVVLNRAKTSGRQYSYGRDVTIDARSRPQVTNNGATFSSGTPAPTRQSRRRSRRDSSGLRPEDATSESRQREAESP